MAGTRVPAAAEDCDAVTPHPPDWVKDAVFYQIFPDRFASSRHVPKPGNLEPWDVPPTQRGFKGGDLLGVLEHLDYLVDLGINAIYLNPIFQSAANHRYHTHDYYQVDPLLGGNEAFDALLAGAHQAGIRIVLDGVFNHAGRGLYQFNHIMENGDQSPYLDWFSVYGFPLWAFDSHRNPTMPHGGITASCQSSTLRTHRFALSSWTWRRRGSGGGSMAGDSTYRWRFRRRGSGRSFASA